ncbi:hypothetical protein DDP44_00470 [Helicobacter pylori]|nr:hypothetical protein DDP44_00470 [Helicobacter pylori]
MIIAPKTQGFACKSGVVLEFGGVCMRLLMIARLVRDAYSFKQSFDSFLKLSSTLIKQSLA